MMSFPCMLVDAAEKAGMKVPADPDHFDGEQFPHFAIFCTVQLGRAIRWGEHCENAKVVATIPDNKIKTITLQELMARGLEYRT